MFDQVITRAFAQLDGILQASKRFLAQQGRILAMKGSKIESEVSKVKKSKAACAITVHDLPHIVDEHRVLAIMELS